MSLPSKTTRIRRLNRASGPFIPPNPILPGEPCIGTDGAVGFLGIGASGQLGVYVKQPSDPIRPAADLNTAQGATEAESDCLFFGKNFLDFAFPIPLEP